MINFTLIFETMFNIKFHLYPYIHISYNYIIITYVNFLWKQVDFEHLQYYKYEYMITCTLQETMCNADIKIELNKTKPKTQIHSKISHISILIPKLQKIMLIYL